MYHHPKGAQAGKIRQYRDGGCAVPFPRPKQLFRPRLIPASVIDPYLGRYLLRLETQTLQQLCCRRLARALVLLRFPT